MLRTVSSAVLALATLAAAQQETRPAPTRTVLRALPLGGDEDINSLPHPAESVVPVPAPLPPPAPAAAVPLVVKPALAGTVPVPSPLDTKPTGEDALRLQIYLDQANFGPGVIDGKPGRFTELAVQSWNEVHGHPIEDWVAANTAARKAVPKTPRAK